MTSDPMSDSIGCGDDSNSTIVWCTAGQRAPYVEAKIKSDIFTQQPATLPRRESVVTYTHLPTWHTVFEHKRWHSDPWPLGVTAYEKLSNLVAIGTLYTLWSYLCHMVDYHCTKQK